MVLTKSELIDSLTNEVRILQHLAAKVDASKVDYRPTPGQRSTIELLRYLTFMGPALMPMILAGQFDPAAWEARQKAADTLDLADVSAALTRQAQEYESILANVPDEAFRSDVEMFRTRNSAGALIVKMVLGGCAAYRTQLFCYLKACGRDELSTMNLWAGMDAPAVATT